MSKKYETISLGQLVTAAPLKRKAPEIGTPKTGRLAVKTSSAASVRRKV